MLIENYESTKITLSAHFESEIISLEDAAAFFTFLNEAFNISLQHSVPALRFGEGLPNVTTNVSVEDGSIKAFFEVLKDRNFRIGIASSLTASVIWAAAAYPWHDVTVKHNVPEQQTSYTIPIDTELAKLAAVMNKTGKPWSLKMSAKDPRYTQELSIELTGNQPRPAPKPAPVPVPM